MTPDSFRRNASYVVWLMNEVSFFSNATACSGCFYQASINAFAQKKAAKSFTPRLKVTLRVGNEFEGKMIELVHEANTLSSLLAEQEAVKAARKRYKYVEVVSVKSM